MNHRAVIFDLDGTLLDTLADLADAMNRVLSAHGFPTHATEAFRYFVGSGAKKLVSRTLPPAQRTDAVIADCLGAFQEEYRRNWREKTHPYDGVNAMLTALNAKGIPLAVLTNKPQGFAEQCVKEYFAPEAFVEVRGQCEDIPMKPDPAGALAIARNMQVPPPDCLYLGDSDIDMQTAKRAGMFPVGAAWGFRTEDELRKAGAGRIITHPKQFLFGDLHEKHPV